MLRRELDLNGTSRSLVDDADDNDDDDDETDEDEDEEETLGLRNVVDENVAERIYIVREGERARERSKGTEVYDLSIINRAERNGVTCFANAQ